MKFLQRFFNRRGSGHGPSTLQRRGSPRYRVQEPCVLRVAQTPMRGVLVELSRQGVRLYAASPLEPGSTLSVGITVDGSTQLLPVRVVWEQLLKNAHECGATFNELSAQQSEHLARYLGQLATRRVPLSEAR